MANPRKFSEKIALHNQRQAEETAAFEAILREVSASTRPVLPKQPSQHDHLQLSQPNLGAYRGGSLPNVNQIANTSGAIDLQGALNSLEGMKQCPGRQSLVDRVHRDRSRPIPGHGRRNAPFDKRADHSPYGSAYLSPPPETSWRRTHSDSALHTSAMQPQMQSLPGGTTPPSNRRVDMPHQHTVDGGTQLLDSGQFWDKKDVGRPKSCEVPGINIYPSPEQDPSVQGVHIPISSNTGSLPDLTNLHFPSGLVTPLDSEDQQAYVQTNQLEVNTDSTNYASYHSPQQQPHSPHQHIPPPHSNVPQICIQVPGQHGQQSMQFLQVPNQRSQVSGQLTNGTHPPPGPANQGPGPGHMALTPPRIATPTSIDSLGSSPEQQQQGEVISQYRNSTSECPQSPTSPLSQHSYSPSQSPGLPPTTLSSSPFSDAYYVQQQAQTNALQHQFEQFNMQMQDVSGTTPGGMGIVYSMVGGTAPLNNIQFSQAALSGLVNSQEFIPVSSQPNNNHYYSSPPQQPSSPKAPSPQVPSPQGPSSPTLQAQGSPQQQQQIPHSPTGQMSQQDPSFGLQTSALINSHLQHAQQNVNNIPDIILTGVDDSLSRQDFVKDISNAMAGMMDAFDSELFPTDEVLKVGLDPLDLDGLQMLTDPNMVTDPATEDSFRLDHL